MTTHRQPAETASQARVKAILADISTARRAADAELSGLRSRLGDVGVRLSFLFGSEVESPAEKDPEDRKRLDAMETELRRGRIRRRYLEDQLRALDEVAVLLSALSTSRPLAQPGSA
jgi:hypothetical protein